MAAVQRRKVSRGNAPTKRNEARSSPEAAIYYLEGCIGLEGISRRELVPSQGGRVPGAPKAPWRAAGRCRVAGQDWGTAGLVTKL